MSELKTIVLEALAELQSFTDCTVDAMYEGLNCPDAVRSSLTDERVVNTYGQREGYSGSIHVPTDFFNAPLKSGNRIVIDDVEYTIMGTSVDSVQALTRIDYGDKFA
jgi:hypothetical protein